MLFRSYGATAGRFQRLSSTAAGRLEAEAPEAIREYRVEERRDKAERKQLDAARRRPAAQAAD